MVKGDDTGKGKVSTHKGHDTGKGKASIPAKRSQALKEAQALAKSMGGSVVLWKRESTAPKPGGGSLSK
jgi:hypothetical protein